MLKNWQENASPEGIFIHLPAEAEKHEIITPIKEPLLRLPKVTPSNLSLRIRNGSWALEGVLSLQDWHSAIRLLEGVK